MQFMVLILTFSASINLFLITVLQMFQLHLHWIHDLVLWSGLSANSARGFCGLWAWMQYITFVILVGSLIQACLKRALYATKAPAFQLELCNLFANLQMITHDKE